MILWSYIAKSFFFNVLWGCYWKFCHLNVSPDSDAENCLVLFPKWNECTRNPPFKFLNVIWSIVHGHHSHFIFAAYWNPSHFCVSTTHCPWVKGAFIVVIKKHHLFFQYFNPSWQLSVPYAILMSHILFSGVISGSEMKTEGWGLVEAWSFDLAEAIWISAWRKDHLGKSCLLHKYHKWKYNGISV